MFVIKLRKNNVRIRGILCEYVNGEYFMSVVKCSRNMIRHNIGTFSDMKFMIVYCVLRLCYIISQCQNNSPVMRILVVNVGTIKKRVQNIWMIMCSLFCIF